MWNNTLPKGRINPMQFCHTQNCSSPWVKCCSLAVLSTLSVWAVWQLTDICRIWGWFYGQASCGDQQPSQDVPRACHGEVLPEGLVLTFLSSCRLSSCRWLRLLRVSLTSLPTQHLAQYSQQIWKVTFSGGIGFRAMQESVLTWALQSPWQSSYCTHMPTG